MKTKIFTLFLTLVASAGTICAWDYEHVQIGDLYYNLNGTNKTAEIISGDYSNLTTLTIPLSVSYIDENYEVLSIEEDAFSSCVNITSVIWNAKHVADFSDGNTPFYHVDLGPAGEIQHFFFDVQSQITSFVFGEEVEYIPNWLCSRLTNLTSIIFPNSVTSIGGDAFRNCSGLTSITIPDNVTSIGNYAFCGCSGVASVTIGNGVTCIGEGVFSGCGNLNSVLIGTGLTQIGPCAFSAWPNVPLTLIFNTPIPPKLITMAECTIFGSDRKIEDIVIYVPCGTLELYKSSWEEYSGIIRNEPLQLDKLKLLVNDVKAGYVTYPEDITICDEEMTIEAVPNPGYHFVQWSDGIKDNPRTIVLTQDTTFIAEFAQTFSGKCGDKLNWEYSANSLFINGSGNMYDFEGEGCGPWILFTEKIRQIYFSADITSIGSEAFSGCTGLRYLSIPNSVKTIGAGAFQGCSNIDTLILGTGITSITDQFHGCANLRYLQLSQNIQNIDYGAFFDARKLNYIACYAKNPPLAYPDEGGLLRSFYNVHAVVLIPCDNYEAYQIDALWGSFNLRCQSSTDATANQNEVTVTSGTSDATFVWPTATDANTYTLEITKDGAVFCTLTFNAQGQLLGIAFAPNRSGQAPQAPSATVSTDGMSFQVTGLDYASQYNFSFNTKNKKEKVIFAYTGQFATVSTQGIEITNDQSPMTNKIIRDDKIFILRGDKVYTDDGRLTN